MSLFDPLRVGVHHLPNRVVGRHLLRAASHRRTDRGYIDYPFLQRGAQNVSLSG
jgi:hypothetical protein